MSGLEDKRVVAASIGDSFAFLLGEDICLSEIVHTEEEEVYEEFRASRKETDHYKAEIERLQRELAEDLVVAL